MQIMLDAGILAGLVHLFCDFGSYEGQQVANQALIAILEACPSSEIAIRNCMGDEIFEAFAAGKQGGALFKVLTESNLEQVRQRLTEVPVNPKQDFDDNSLQLDILSENDNLDLLLEKRHRQKAGVLSPSEATDRDGGPLQDDDLGNDDPILASAALGRLAVKLASKGGRSSRATSVSTNVFKQTMQRITRRQFTGGTAEANDPLKLAADLRPSLKELQQTPAAAAVAMPVINSRRSVIGLSRPRRGLQSGTLSAFFED